MELLTVNTYPGLFQYTWLPFGVKTTPTLFLQIMDTMLTGVEGAAAYLNDVIVVGQSKQDVREQTNKVQTRIQDFGFQLWLEKCHFYLQANKYLGFIFNSYGHHPNPTNVAAIQRMPPPSDISSLHSFLGLMSNYGSFRPSLHQIKAPLNQLLTKDIKWTWPVDCQQSFKKIKASLNSNLQLIFWPNSEDSSSSWCLKSWCGNSDFSHFCFQIRKGYHACSQIPSAH